MSDIRYNVEHRTETCAFMSDLIALFKHHGMCIVPTYGGSVSYHDAMTVTRYDNEAEDFVKLTQVDVDNL